MGKKFLAIITVLVLAFCNVSVVFSEELQSQNKDETVYVMLKNNGSTDYIKVVNRLGTEAFEDDYEYKDVPASQLPVLISLKYYINDVETSAEKLAGSSGEIKLRIGIMQNDKCADSMKDVYMTQLQVPLSLKHARIKKFDGTSSVITGDLATLSYAVLPGADADFDLILEAKDFEMDSLQIALVEYTSDVASQFGELIDGVHTMGEKAGEMIDGTTGLKEGMGLLTDGAGKLDAAVSKINNGANGIVKGMKDYSDGLKEYQTGLTSAVNGLDDSLKGLQQINAGAAPLLKGYEDMAGALSQMDMNHGALVKLAQKLQNSNDPEIQALCQGVIAEAGGLSQASEGMKQANQGLSAFLTGLDKFGKGMEALNQGIKSLPAGFGQLVTGFEKLRIGNSEFMSGFGSLKKGVSNFSGSIAELPGNVQKLIDGQYKFKDGIIEMETKIKAGISPEKNYEPVSFVDGRTKVKSLQFIMKTPEIKIVEKNEDIKSSNNDKLSWYQKIWNRLVNLF